MVDDGVRGEAHADAGVVGRVADGVARVAALHVVRVRVAVQQRRAHVARDHARAALRRRHVLLRHCSTYHNLSSIPSYVEMEEVTNAYPHRMMQPVQRRAEKYLTQLHSTLLKLFPQTHVRHHSAVA